MKSREMGVHVLTQGLGEALARANFFQSNRHLVLGIFSEYSGTKLHSPQGQSTIVSQVS